ncbi:MAG: hypothetical protein WC966_02315 [Bradymonadales bacterium]
MSEEKYYRSRSFAKIGVLGFLIVIVSVVVLACSKTPEDVRAWLKDKRAPAKMQEFIESKHSEDVKVEAVMVLVERGQADKIPDAVNKLQSDERNKVAKKVSSRLVQLMESGNETSEMRAKDGAFYMRRLDLDEEIAKELNAVMLSWISKDDNFFRPIDRVGRVEQKRIFESVGPASLPVFIGIFEDMFAELNEKGPDINESIDVQKRMQNALKDLDGLKVAGANDAIAKLFAKNFEAAYPNLADIYGAPFINNNSEILIPLAKKVMLDKDYTNNYLNALRDIVVNDYYNNIQTKEGIAICSQTIIDDKSGFLRWMCVDLLTQKLGKDSVKQILTSLPDSKEDIEIPEDHPLVGTFKKGEFTWFEFESYCRALSFNLNNQVPLDVLRQFASNGRRVERMLSMMCLSFNGAQSDKQFLESLRNDRTDISSWGTNARTLGDFAMVCATLFDERHKKRDSDMAKKADEDAQESAPAENI